MKKWMVYGTVLYVSWKAASFVKDRFRMQKEEQLKGSGAVNDEGTLQEPTLGLSVLSRVYQVDSDVENIENSSLILYQTDDEELIYHALDDSNQSLGFGFGDRDPDIGEPYKKEVKSISRILQFLMHTLDEKNEHHLLSHYGRLNSATSSVNQATEETEEEVLKLEKRIGCRLPKDHRSFLTEFNGARIYDQLLDGRNISGGFHLFSVKEIFENIDYMDTVYPGYLPIGDVEQQYLAISLDALNNDDPNYLFRLDNMEGPTPLNLNLIMFVDYFVVSQGSVFWEWPLYDAANFRLFEEDEN